MTQETRVWLGLTFMAAVAIAVGVIIGAVTHARGATEDQTTVPGVQWKLVVVVESKDGDKISLTYGSQATGAILFSSKEECEANKKTDEALAKAVASVLAVAAVRGDKVVGVNCVLNDDGAHV